MAQLTTNWTLLGEKYLGSSHGNLYVRIYARCTQQDVANNRSYIEYNASTYFSGNYIKDNQGAIGCSGTGANWGQTGCTYVTGGEKGWITRGGWITHWSDGNLTISATAILHFPNWGWKGEVTGYASLQTIPRQAHLTAASNFNDEQNPIIEYNNPAGNIVASLEACISLTGATDDIKYRAIPKTGSSYEFNLTAAERELLRSNCTTSNSRTVSFHVRTVIGGQTFYSHLAKTLTIINADPTIEAADAVDTLAEATALTGSNTTIIKGHNKIKVDMTVSTLKGATIKDYSITTGGLVVKSDTGYIDNAESGDFTFLIRDSRGNVASKIIKMNVIDYIPLSISMEKSEIALNSADGTKADIDFTVKGAYFGGSFGKVANALNLSYEVNGTRTFIQIDPANIQAIGNEFTATQKIVGLDYTKAYVVNIKVADKLQMKTIATKTLRAIPLFDWSETDFNFNVPIKMNGEPMFEKGTWIPTAKSNVIINSYSDCEYYKIGELVFIKGCINVQNGGNLNAANGIGGLPFPASADRQFIGITYTNHTSHQGTSYALETYGRDLYFVYWANQRTWDLDRCLGDNPGTLFFSGAYIAKKEGVISKNE